MGKKLLTQLCCPPLVRSKPYVYLEIIHYITEDYIFRYASKRKKGSSHTFLVNGKNKVTVYILWSLHWVEPWFSLPRGPGALKSKPRVFHGYDISLKKKKSIWLFKHWKQGLVKCWNHNKASTNKVTLIFFAQKPSQKLHLKMDLVTLQRQRPHKRRFINSRAIFYRFNFSPLRLWI